MVLFATNTIGNKTADLSPIVVWGTLPSDTFTKYTSSVLEKQKDSLRLTYIQKDEDTFEQSLVEAIADDQGPDVIILSQDSILRNRNRILTIPYTTLPISTFNSTFINESSIYLTDSGIQAIPFVVDPLVMYYNKSHFTNASIVNPPQYWDAFKTVVQKLTQKDSNFNVTKSGVALGEYDNIDHAKDILSMLMLQAGAPMIGKNKDGKYISMLSGSYGNTTRPAEAALTFYTDFANPASELYSWNKSLSSSMSAFISGNLSMYFGYASELPTITLKNPNLNFDVALVPQSKDADTQVVFGKIYGFAILKSSKNVTSAFTQINTLTSKDFITLLTDITGLPPIRKDVLANSPKDPYMQVFYNSALRAKAWLDPSPKETNDIFRNMVESVIVGKTKPNDMITLSQREFDNILNSINK